MAIFGTKPLVNPSGKMSTFSTFWTSCFYSLERRFFVLEYHKRHFSWPILPKKKKVGKMAIFGPKPWVTPLEKCQFFYFWTSCFYSLDRCFFVVEYHKRHFSDLFWLKKEIRKMASFGPKPWVNPFGKMSIFRLFELLVFIA